MRPKEFGTIHGKSHIQPTDVVIDLSFLKGYMSNGYWPRVCESIDFKLYCWFINFEEFEDFEPGIYERMGRLDSMGRPLRDSELRRDRHLWLKWDKASQESYQCK